MPRRKKENTGEYLSVNQVASRYGISRHTVRNWLDQGLTHIVLPNGYYHIKVADIEDFLKNRTAGKHVEKKVLIIDDDKQFLDNTAAIIKKKGYNVLSSSNIVDGLLKIKSFRPNLILLDIVFPEQDGWELAEELDRDPELKGIPILFVSGEVSGRDIFKKCLSMNGVGFLEKPFAPPTLLAEIEQAFRNIESD